jgi:hypothetical protein
MQPEDVARGLPLHAHDASALQEWASDVLAGSDDLDLDSPDGDLLLNALWDASFEARITDEALALARRLVES